MKQYKAIVSFSGGQDSTTVLALACKVHGSDSVLAVSVDYGQRHANELEASRLVADRFGVAYKRVTVGGYSVDTALQVGGSEDVTAPHALADALPASFVPGRNAILFAVMHGLAQSHGASVIYGGQCETDYSGYPDCRRIFVDELAMALNRGRASRSDIEIRTPLMYLNKAQTFALAEKLGVLTDIISLTHTCYKNETDVAPWGRGCGECPACALRRRGWEEFRSLQYPMLTQDNAPLLFQP